MWQLRGWGLLLLLYLEITLSAPDFNKGKWTNHFLAKGLFCTCTSMHCNLLNISVFAPLSKSSTLRCSYDMTGKVWLFYFSSVAFSQKTHEMKHYIGKLSACLIISLYKGKKENKAEEIVIHGISLFFWSSYSLSSSSLSSREKNHFSFRFFTHAAILLQKRDIT